MIKDTLILIWHLFNGQAVKNVRMYESKAEYLNEMKKLQDKREADLNEKDLAIRAAATEAHEIQKKAAYELEAVKGIKKENDYLRRLSKPVAYPEPARVAKEMVNSSEGIAAAGEFGYQAALRAMLYYRSNMQDANKGRQ